ncbi:MAG: RidA family protein [Gammaproteobacteria bacterium]|nr:RidA family protein [Gammaproteobacteria bacterium]MXY57312.1 RidA family protein [Gammaproteobacteria bacterium]MYF31750.1 RidA family protein [Gammaproteobacteria bacterium]MYK47443.1 RidA family protein [Gammaproteobacteria bacterium]
MSRRAVHTDAAPQAIGTYSQALAVDRTVYLSGQIPLDPESMELVAGGFHRQVQQVLDNLHAVASAAGGGLGDIVKLTVYLTDLKDFEAVNQVMAREFSEPYPARAAVEVAALPRGARVEIDAVLVLPG